MGWQIHNNHCTIKITEDCAKELFNSDHNQTYETWFELEDIRSEDGILQFNTDHMEHMDYLNDNEIKTILLKHNSTGEAYFTCAEGDWAGDAWGHRFVDGKYVELVGITTYVPKDELK